MTATLANKNPVCASAPESELPAGGWDCHCHVFGPYGSFPLAPEASYVPPECPLDAYLQLLDTLGLARGVLVQPSAHGLDNAAMLHALASAPDRLRGVAVVDRGATLDDLKALARQGVRGLRFSRLLLHGKSRYKNTVDIDALPDLLPLMRRTGMHVQLWADLDQLPALAPLIRSAGVPFVLDHMGRIDPAKGPEDPDFGVLCQLLEEGHAWVKLTPYRRSELFPDYPDLRIFHDRLLAANPEQLVWGCDWPHVNMPEKMPDPGYLLDLLVKWTRSRDLLQNILVANPERLYGF